MSQTDAPLHGRQIDGRESTGSDPLLAIHRIMRPELYGYLDEPRDWTPEVMSEVNEAVEEALRANGNPDARFGSEPADTPARPTTRTMVDSHQTQRAASQPD